MSLDRMDSKVGLLAFFALPTSGGFPGGHQFGGEAGFAPGQAAQTGGALIQSPTPRSGTVPTLANSGTITHNNCGVAKTTNAGATTGNIIQVGQFDGQHLVYINEGSGSVTMAAAGTSNVANGTTSVVPALAAALFVWDAAVSRWFGTNL